MIFTQTLEKTLSNLDLIIAVSIFFGYGLYYLIDRRKLFVSIIYFILGLFFFVYLRGILLWFSSLGADSFLESRDFEISESIFLIKSLLLVLPSIQIPSVKTQILVAVYSIILAPIVFYCLKKSNLVRIFFPIAQVVTVVYLLFFCINGFYEGRAYIDSLNENYSMYSGDIRSNNDIDLFVYIGESTTSFNMGIYGYPRDTTPKLQELLANTTGLIKFDNVRSTHTHTSLSLLRALTVRPSNNHRDEYWGIGTVLFNAGLQPELYSSQPLSGSAASFSKYIYNGMKKNVPSDDKYIGNYTRKIPLDHSILQPALGVGGVVFFHSYAGHGNYINNIDEGLSKSFRPYEISKTGLFGLISSGPLGVDPADNVNHYDQSITYIDNNVSTAIENIRSRRKPSVLIYFSDHGESVYTNRGHDSSNYVEEMSAVPLIIYFNDAYISKYPDTVKQYRMSSKSNNVKLLDQVAPTILDVLQLEPHKFSTVPTLRSSTKHPNPSILERITSAGASVIDLNYVNLNTSFKNSPPNGIATTAYISLLNNLYGSQNKFCYHRSNSYAKALRAAFYSNCIEFDLNVDGLDLNIHHPPLEKTGFQLKDIFKIASTRKSNLWIDAKNIDSAMNCQVLLDYLNENHHRVGQILVEFPSSAIDSIHEISRCVNNMKLIGVKTSYYLPTDKLLECADDSIRLSQSCSMLSNAVHKAVRSGIFSDLSFDYLGYPAVSKIPSARDLTWNTWAIKVNDFFGFPRNKFKFIIMDTTGDPNTY